MNSSLNISEPEVFGPIYWDLIHRTALNVNSTEEKYNFIKFFVQIIHHLPCQKCKSHALEYYKKNPFTTSDLQSKDGLFKYTYRFHDTVNKRLRKPTLSYDDALQKYLTFEPCFSCGIDELENEPTSDPKIHQNYPYTLYRVQLIPKG